MWLKWLKPVLNLILEILRTTV